MDSADASVDAEDEPLRVGDTSGTADALADGSVDAEAAPSPVGDAGATAVPEGSGPLPGRVEIVLGR